MYTAWNIGPYIHCCTVDISESADVIIRGFAHDSGTGPREGQPEDAQDPLSTALHKRDQAHWYEHLPASRLSESF